VATANHDARRFYARYGLAPGAVDHHPVTGRERIAYHWHPGGA
jgi:putative acetyltransferase